MQPEGLAQTLHGVLVSGHPEFRQFRRHGPFEEPHAPPRERPHFRGNPGRQPRPNHSQGRPSRSAARWRSATSRPWGWSGCRVRIRLPEGFRGGPDACAVDPHGRRSSRPLFPRSRPPFSTRGTAPNAVPAAQSTRNALNRMIRGNGMVGPPAASPAPQERATSRSFTRSSQRRLQRACRPSNTGRPARKRRMPSRRASGRGNRPKVVS